jgi:hypothetical protein
MCLWRASEKYITGAALDRAGVEYISSVWGCAMIGQAKKFHVVTACIIGDYIDT